MICRARRVSHSKFSLGDCFLVAIVIAMFAVIVYQLPRAMDIEADMATASAKIYQPVN